MTNKEVLTKALKLLYNSSPEEYSNFVTALDNYALDVTLAVTEVGPEALLNAQGRAQMIRSLVQQAAEATKQSNKP